MNYVTDEKGETSWETYEQVAQYLLGRFADVFQLGSVEDKQIVAGENGAEWEIDAKGVEFGGEGFVIVECKRYPKSRINQGTVADLAYRILNTGAQRGIIVSPLGLQEGAKKVAEYAGIVSVRLRPESTTAEYVLQVLNKTFVGFSATLKLHGSLSARLSHAECASGDHPKCSGCDCECHGGAARLLG